MPALSLFDTAKGGIVTLEATGEQSMYVCGISRTGMSDGF